MNPVLRFLILTMALALSTGCGSSKGLMSSAPSNLQATQTQAPSGTTTNQYGPQHEGAIDLTFTSPNPGDLVSGTITVSVTSSMASQIASLELTVDGVSQGTVTSTPYTFSVDTTKFSDGFHNLEAQATDATGNTSSTTIVVQTANQATPATDATAPTASFSSPTDGSTITGSVSILVNAQDNVAVASVTLTLDGSPMATLTQAPYTYTWDTTKATDGSHTLVATVADTSGNPTLSQVTVTVSNGNALSPTPTPVAIPMAPVVSFMSPMNGDSVTGKLSVQVSASDAYDAIKKVEFFVDGKTHSTLKGTSSSTYTFKWNSKHHPDGMHRLQVAAWDVSGLETLTSIMVQVDNFKLAPPHIKFLSPKVNAKVSGTLDAEVYVTNSADVASVSLMLDKNSLGNMTMAGETSLTGLYGMNIDTTLLSNGSHTLKATVLTNEGKSIPHSIKFKSSNGKIVMPLNTQTSPVMMVPAYFDTF